MLNYKFRLYPTIEQEKRLVEVIEISRVVYNYFISNNFKSRNEMNYALTELKEQQPILRNYHNKMLQMVSTKVAAAWAALEELKKRGREAGNGKLGFLMEGECHSFTYNQSGFKLEQCFDGKSLLRLSRIGHIEIRIHRKLPIFLKQVTILRQAGKWFAIIACAILRKVHSSIRYQKPVGIDVGITNYAYDSDGNHGDNPLFLENKASLYIERATKESELLMRESYDKLPARQNSQLPPSELAHKWHRNSRLQVCSCRPPSLGMLYLAHSH